MRLSILMSAVVATISSAFALDDDEPLTAAKALMENGRYAEAIEALSNIIDGARDRAVLERAYFERAEAWHSIAFQQPGQDQPLIEALEDYTRAIRVYANNQLTRRSRATIYAELGAYDEALEELKELEKLEASTNVPFWSLVRVGGIKRVLGDYEGAIAVFDQAIENYRPEPVMPPNYHKAITLLKMKDPERALQALDEGLKAQPDYASAYHFRACANAALGRFDQALLDLGRQEQLESALPAPGAKLASREHDARIEAERRAYLEEVLAGKRAADDAEIDRLCFSSWWMTHFQTRRVRSALLPKQ